MSVIEELQKSASISSTISASQEVIESEEGRLLFTHNTFGTDKDAQILLLQERLRKCRKEIESLREKIECKDQVEVNTLSKFPHRAMWLVVLLLFQSSSSCILQYFDPLIHAHPVVVYFLTMLVGAGGNAGSQSTVLVIRGFSTGEIRDGNSFNFFVHQVWVGVRLGAILFVASFVRTFLFRTKWIESLAICTSMFTIVLTSTIIGTMLPLLLRKFGLDPAHSGAAIQVMMDVIGVTITCLVGCTLLRVSV